MKKLAALSMGLFILASCSLTTGHNEMAGRRFKVLDPEKVPFYKEPSLKSEKFHTGKPQEFVVEYFQCRDGKIYLSCMLSLIMGALPGEELWYYRVRFESGENGYINTRDFHTAPDYILDVDKHDQFAPRVYTNVEYDRVWRAAVETLDELGFVIAQMRREEGYLATGMKESQLFRNRVNVSLTRADDSVIVEVSEYSEHRLEPLRGGHIPLFWIEDPPDGPYRKMLQERIASKIYR